jgi:periplasmic divalent cation tolerance protein
MPLIEIRINCPDPETAVRIGERLVAARLAACVNIGGRVDSIYRWQGAVERAAEIPLVVKTRAELFEAAAREAAALHPWEVPAITATEIVAAAPSYRDWILAGTEPPR